MHIASRISISLLVTVLTVLLASTALAEGGGGGPDHRPGTGHPPEVDQPEHRPGAAKIAMPRADRDGVTETFTPIQNKELKGRMIAARKNWVVKKGELDAANAARAKAEYRASQNGSPVDPAIIARQGQAKKQAAEAHAVFGPLVEEGHAAGMSPEVLDLYERAIASD